MTTSEDLKGTIAAVRVAAEDPRGAYLIRSRLRRSLLACARAVAESEGLQKPALAGQWVNPRENDARLVEDICRRIYQRSETLCQPSESFDVRWDAGWRDLQADLAALELAVGSLALTASSPA